MASPPPIHTPVPPTVDSPFLSPPRPNPYGYYILEELPVDSSNMQAHDNAQVQRGSNVMTMQFQCNKL